MSNDCPYQESELLTRVAGGDEKAFSEIVNRYAAVIYAHILTYNKDPYQAEEITQDIFVAIWKNREALPAVDNFKAYLFRAARNRTISAFRQKLRHTEYQEQDELDNIAANENHQLEYRELSEFIQRGIELLPPRRKQVFKLSRLEGKTYEEIARQLNISRSSVNQHIVEALVFLRTYLRDTLAFGLAVALFYPLLH